MKNLPIIQKTYDLVKGYLPILNRLPHDHKLEFELVDARRYKDVSHTIGFDLGGWMKQQQGRSTQYPSPR